MKRTSFFRLCLCLLLFALLSACGTPSPEESSVPAGDSLESGEVIPPVVEDENAKAVRAYFEELLEKEWSAEWLTEERAETIRNSVKQLKTPILTGEDVLSLAARAARAYFAVWQEEQAIRLPACGVLDTVYSDTAQFLSYVDHAYAYNALFAYTVYLFTPPNYVFWGKEVWNDEWYPSGNAGADPSYALCLPLAPAAGEYTNRSGALADMREKESCIRLYPLHVSDGERPLNFSYCGQADLLLNGSLTFFDLLAFARRGGADLSEELLAQYARAYVMERFNRIVYGGWLGTVSDYALPGGDTVSVYQLLTGEEAQELREHVEMLSGPFLTVEMVQDLEIVVRDLATSKLLLLLSGIDGADDLLLPPGIKTLEDALQMPAPAVAAKAQGAVAYLLDLFTPSACRFDSMFAPQGTCYALNETGAYVLVTEAYKQGYSTGLQYLAMEEPMA